MKNLYLLFPDANLDLSSFERIDPDVYRQEFHHSYNTYVFSLLDCFFIDALRETLENSAMVSMLSEKEIVRIEHRLLKVRDGTNMLQDKPVDIEHKKKILAVDEQGFKLNCKKLAEGFVFRFKNDELSESELLTLLKEVENESSYRQFVEPTLTQLHKYIDGQKRNQEPILILAEPSRENEWENYLWIRI